MTSTSAPSCFRKAWTYACGLPLLAALIVPSASAVEPMIERGNEPGFHSGARVDATGDPPLMVEASASSFDWSAALVVVLIGLAILVTVVAVHHVGTRRGSQLAAR